MVGLIKAGIEFKEGELFNKYLHSRLIVHNKNVLLATTGSTGSGKSYTDLRVAELWYNYYFKEPFPIENVCFSIEEITNLLAKKKLRRGEVLILEEGGVNLGSLDFQNKISKMFTYVLQSFRSMNLCLIINLPFLSMLNKSARLLLHVNFVTTGIDFQNKVSRIKPFFHQVNQSTGKIYPKYMRINKDGGRVTFKVFSYGLPSKELTDAYEKRKEMFLQKLIVGNSNTMQGNFNTIQGISMPITPNKFVLTHPLTDFQQKIMDCINQGITKQKDIAQKIGSRSPKVHMNIKFMRNKGYLIEKLGNTWSIPPIKPSPLN